ncbi:MAG: glycosyltransferase family 39 protein [Dehalococcoidia bacterium]
MPRPAHRALVAPTTPRPVLRRAIPLGLIGLAFGLRVATIADRPLWFDEGYSIYFAGVSPLETAQLTAIDIHPPLYYWLLQLWTWLVGWNDISVRLFSVVIGTATVALLMRFGSEAFGRRAGALAAAALAISPLHVTYSVEVRMYALLALFATTATWAWWLLPRRRTLGIYAVAMGAALLTQYYAGFLLAAHALTVPVFRNGRARLLGLALASAPFTLWALYAGPNLARYVQQKTVVESYAPLDPLAFFAGFGAAAFGGGVIGSIAAMIIAGLAVAGMVRPVRPLTLLLAGSIAVPLVLGYFVNLIYPFNPPGWERLLLFVLPAWLLLAAHGTVRLARRLGDRPVALLAGGAAAAIVLLGSFIGLARFASRPPADDPRPMIREVERLATPGDLYLAVYPWQVGYLRLYDRRPQPDIRLIPGDAWAADPARLAAELRRLAAGRRVWLPAYQRLGHTLEDRLERAFGQQLYLISSDWYGDHRLLFSRDGAPGEVRARDVRFNDLRLIEARVDPAPIASGVGATPISLRWSGATQPTEVHLRLADSRGITWAQNDGPLATGSAEIVDGRAILAPPGTPPGRYRLLLSVSGSGERWPVVVGGAAPVPELDLGEIEVGPPVSSIPPEALAIGRPWSIRAAPGLRLLGSDFSSGPYRPGDSVLVSLYWLPELGGLTAPDLRVGDSRVGGTSADWLPGQPVREVREAIVRESGNLAVAVESASGPLVLGRIEVSERPAPPDLAPAIALDARFEDQLRLLGATVSNPSEQPLISGTLSREMDVDLFWRTDRPLDDDLAVFVHLVGPDGRPVAQHDSRPASGLSPTRGWRPGEVVLDHHRLSVPPGVPAGDYRIIVGLYQPPAGPRLLTAGGDSVTVLAGALR